MLSNSSEGYRRSQNVLKDRSAKHILLKQAFSQRTSGLTIDLLIQPFVNPFKKPFLITYHVYDTVLDTDLQKWIRQRAYILIWEDTETIIL